MKAISKSARTSGVYTMRNALRTEVNDVQCLLELLTPHQCKTACVLDGFPVQVSVLLLR